MCEYKIEILAPAWHEIEEIADMHLSLVGSTSAEKITNKIFDTIDLLKTNPYMGRECEDTILSVDHYRKILIGKYLCFYRVIADTIFIYHIVNGKRNYPKIFESDQEELK